MTEQAPHDLRRVRRPAATLQRLVADTRGDLPDRAEGTDRTGAVRVVLGGDGLPTSIEVGADWQHRVVASAFGDAVLDAFHTATRARIEAWSEALRRPARPVAPAEVVSRPWPAVPVVPAEVVSRHRPARPPVDGSAARSMTTLVEEVLNAADEFARRGAAPPAMPTGTGSDGTGRLMLTLSAAGVESCIAPAHWLSCQHADDLTAALARALAAARADLGTAQAGQGGASEPDARLHRVLDELFAAVADPRRPGRS